FFDMPKGSTIYMEKVAKEYILANVQTNHINKNRLVQMIKQFTINSNQTLTLRNFINYYNLDLVDVYSKSTKRNFAWLFLAAVIVQCYNDRFEREFTNQVHKLFHLDSPTFIDDFIYIITEGKDKPQQVISMLYYSFFNEKPENAGFVHMLDGIKQLFSNE